MDDGLSLLFFLIYPVLFFCVLDPFLFFVCQQTEQLTNDKMNAFAFDKYMYRSSSSDCTTYCIHRDNISQGMFSVLPALPRPSILTFLCFSLPFFVFPHPRNLKRAIELANIVADSRYRLYETFSGNGGRSLLDYLQVVRQAVLAGVENGGSDPFRIIAAL